MADITLHKPVRSLRAIDLAVLLVNVYEAAKNKEVGFEDANETMDTLIAKMNKEFYIELSVLESALWSCNLLDEAKGFWHPKDMSFAEYVKKLFPKDTFDRIYNTLEEKHGRG